MAVLQMVPGSAPSAGSEDAALQKAAQHLPPDETQLLYSLCLHGRAELGLAPDEYAALTMVLLRLLAFKPPSAPLAEKKTLKFEPPLPAADSVEDPTTTPVAEPVSHPQAVQDNGGQAVALGDFWYDTVMALVSGELVTALVRELALQAELVSAPGLPGSTANAVQNAWTLQVPSESLAQASTRDRLQAALNSQGIAVRLQVQIGPVQDSPAKRLAAKAAERQRLAEAVIHQDPFVQAMMRDYGGKIVPGSLKPV
jgi:DNA polymerase-3 subunit gamma/tau